MTVSVSTVKASESINRKATKPLLNGVQVNDNSTNLNIRTLLIRAKSRNEEASRELLEHFKDFISTSARLVSWKSYRWLSQDELESEGKYGLVKAILHYDPLIHHSPRNYVIACIRNTMKDYVKKEAPVHVPFSAVLSKNNNELRLEQIVPDPYAEDLNECTHLPNIEDLRELLKRDDVKKIFRNFRNRRIIELIYSVHLGSNPNKLKLLPKEIASILGISEGHLFMIKSRVLKKLRALCH